MAAVLGYAPTCTVRSDGDRHFFHSSLEGYQPVETCVGFVIDQSASMKFAMTTSTVRMDLVIQLLEKMMRFIVHKSAKVTLVIYGYNDKVSLLARGDVTAESMPVLMETIKTNYKPEGGTDFLAAVSAIKSLESEGIKKCVFMSDGEQAGTHAFISRRQDLNLPESIRIVSIGISPDHDSIMCNYFNTGQYLSATTVASLSVVGKLAVAMLVFTQYEKVSLVLPKETIVVEHTHKDIKFGFKSDDLRDAYVEYVLPNGIVGRAPVSVVDGPSDFAAEDARQELVKLLNDFNRLDRSSALFLLIQQIKLLRLKLIDGPQTPMIAYMTEVLRAGVYLKGPAKEQYVLNALNVMKTQSGLIPFVYVPPYFNPEDSDDDLDDLEEEGVEMSASAHKSASAPDEGEYEGVCMGGACMAPDHRMELAKDAELAKEKEEMIRAKKDAQRFNEDDPIFWEMEAHELTF